MDLSINSIKYSNLQAKPIAKPINTASTLPIQTAATITQLPSFAQSAHLIPFGQQNYLTAKDFMLPEKCQADRYQIQAGKAIRRGENVVVTAPTGTGKTAIANFAIQDNFKAGKRTFYTTPLKALSNQKYRDLQKMFGKKNVGILTGDKKENAKAPIVVMTTEIYRNMAASNFYNDKNTQLDNLKSVIFDEFHYMNDNERGTIWEESIMFTPKETQIIALSATVGNNTDIKKWVQDKSAKKTTLIDVPIDKRHVKLDIKTIYLPEEKNNVNSKNTKGRNNKRTKGKRFDHKQKLQESEYVSVNDVLSQIYKLKHDDKLPSITFVFSKKFAADLIDASGKKGIDLTENDEKKKIKEILRKYKREKNLYTKNLDETALLKGYAIHSAAILPTQKEFVEELFNKKLIKVVYATETLAAGINMPARSVIMTDVEKPANDLSGQKTKRPLTPNEFHQMSGRAGRRGMDKIGYVYLLAPNKEKKEKYESLKTALPDKIESKLKLDAATVTGLFQKTPKRQKMKEILDMSFFVFDQSEGDKVHAIDEQMDIFDAYTELLNTYDCLEEVPNGYRTTEKGKLVNSIKGKPQLPILQAILNKTFENVSPEDFAGVVSAIAISPTEKDVKLTSKYESEINRVNTQIDNLIEQFPDATTKKVNHDMPSHDILNYISEKASTIKDEPDGEALFNLQTYELQRRLEELNAALVEIEAEEEFIGGPDDETNNRFNKTIYQIELTNQCINLQLAHEKLTAVLDYRDKLIEQEATNGTKQLNELYKKVSDEYDTYNYFIKNLNVKNAVPQAKLNPTAMELVHKWARLNAQSDDYETNWEEINNDITKNPEIKYEGNFFNIVAQTVDFINQIDEFAYNAIPMSKNKDLQYLNQLRTTCKDAVKLLKKPPLYNDNNPNNLTEEKTIE